MRKICLNSRQMGNCTVKTRSDTNLWGGPGELLGFLPLNMYLHFVNNLNRTCCRQQIRAVSG